MGPSSVAKVTCWAVCSRVLKKGFVVVSSGEGGGFLSCNLEKETKPDVFTKYSLFWVCIVYSCRDCIHGVFTFA